MKNKILYATLLILILGVTPNLEGQVLYPFGQFNGIGNGTTPGAVGIATSAPRGRLEILPMCTTSGTFPTLLVSRPFSPVCLPPLSYGSYFEAREWGINNTWATKFIISSGGRVGIGTNNPLQEFHVVGNTYTTGKATIGILNPSNPGTKFHVHNGAMMVSGPNSNGGPMVLFSDNTTTHPNGRWGIEYVPNKGLNFWKPFNPGQGGGTNYHMFIKDDGKVGIGIDPDHTTPNMPNSMPNGYKLFVKDGILTEMLRVVPYGTLAWSDYVFEDDYHRNTLAYVEEYVKENNHLPNVPSSDEVAKEGIDVVKMDAALLRQIEELWLHVIDLKKENQELRSQIDHQ